MTPVFSEKLKCDALKEELERWRGTPFIGHCAMRGVGTDCVRFSAAVMQALGYIEPIEWPPYPLNGGSAETLEMLCARIESAGFAPVELTAGESPMIGDVLVFSSNRFHHVGLMGEGGRFWHCLRGIGVDESLLADSTFGERLFRVYRLLTKGETI